MSNVDSRPANESETVMGQESRPLEPLACMSQVPDPPSVRTSLEDQCRLERLKFILDQQKFLNQFAHKYLIFFQSVVAAIGLATVAVFMAWSDLDVTTAIARTAMRTLEFLLIATGLFVVVLVVATVSSWWDYRHDEAELLDESVRSGFRKKPSVAGLWRWSETWLLVAVVVVVGGGVVLMEQFVLPLIK